MSGNLRQPDWRRELYRDFFRNVTVDPADVEGHFVTAMAGFRAGRRRAGHRDSAAAERQFSEHLCDGLMAARQLRVYVYGMGVAFALAATGRLPTSPIVDSGMWMGPNAGAFRDRRVNALMDVVAPVLEYSASQVYYRPSLGSLEYFEPFETARRFEKHLRHRLGRRNLDFYGYASVPNPQQARDVVAALYKFDDVCAAVDDFDSNVDTWAGLQRYFLEDSQEMFEDATHATMGTEHLAFEMQTPTARKEQQRRQRLHLPVEGGVCPVMHEGKVEGMRLRLLTDNDLRPDTWCPGPVPVNLPDAGGGRFVRRRRDLFESIGLSVDGEGIDAIAALSTTVALLAPLVSWRNPKFAKTALGVEPAPADRGAARAFETYVSKEISSFSRATPAERPRSVLHPL